MTPTTSLPLTVLLLAVAATAQTTINVPCNADNTLYQDPAGSVSNGSGPSVFIGVNASASARRALLRFDVSGTIPAGATIVAAALSFNVVMTTAGTPIAVTGHRITQAWGEGTSVGVGGGGGGGPASVGDATWLHTFFPTSNWSSPGGDYVALPSFTMSCPTSGIGTSPLAAGLAADVQFFLDTPAQNFGWLLRTDELLPFTARRIDSRESTGTKPSLSVTYLLPGQAGSWGVGCPIGAGNFTAAFLGAPIGGTTISIAQSGAPPLGIGTTFYSLDLDAPGVPLLPGCTVYLPLALPLIPGAIYVTDPAGAAAQPFGVPAGYPGYLVVGQSIVLDSNPLGFVISNAALACLL